jgi:hypothetical protein
MVVYVQRAIDAPFHAADGPQNNPEYCTVVDTAALLSAG